MTKLTDLPQIETAPVLLSDPAMNECPMPPMDTPDAEPAPLLRGQQRPTPIGPPIPNHPLAPFIGSFNDEPLWDEWQEAIRVYRQRMNEQQDDEE